MLENVVADDSIEGEIRKREAGQVQMEVDAGHPEIRGDIGEAGLGTKPAAESRLRGHVKQPRSFRQQIQPVFQEQINQTFAIPGAADGAKYARSPTAADDRLLGQNLETFAPG